MNVLAEEPKKMVWLYYFIADCRVNIHNNEDDSQAPKGGGTVWRKEKECHVKF